MSSLVHTYINKPIKFNGVLSSQPIFLSDSKARYILDYRYLMEEFGRSIDFQFRSGARFLDLFFWLQKNLHHKVNQYGKIVLYVWLGTCDLTAKKSEFITVGSRNKKVTYIDLRHETDTSAVLYVKQQIDKFRQFVSHFRSAVKIVFLEIPYYSIEKYNRHLKVSNPESYHESDLILTERISILNDYIREVNEASGFNTPRFNRDLVKYRKRSRSGDKKKLRFFRV